MNSLCQHNFLNVDDTKHKLERFIIFPVCIKTPLKLNGMFWGSYFLWESCGLFIWTAFWGIFSCSMYLCLISHHHHKMWSFRAILSSQKRAVERSSVRRSSVVVITVMKKYWCNFSSFIDNLLEISHDKLVQSFGRRWLINLCCYRFV